MSRFSKFDANICSWKDHGKQTEFQENTGRCHTKTTSFSLEAAQFQEIFLLCSYLPDNLMLL